MQGQFIHRTGHDSEPIAPPQNMADRARRDKRGMPEDRTEFNVASGRQSEWHPGTLTYGRTSLGERQSGALSPTAAPVGAKTNLLASLWLILPIKGGPSAWKSASSLSLKPA